MHALVRPGVVGTMCGEARSLLRIQVLVPGRYVDECCRNQWPDYTLFISPVKTGCIPQSISKLRLLHYYIIILLLENSADFVR